MPCLKQIDNKYTRLFFWLFAHYTLQEEEDDGIDPELKAQQDREVEEFRKRLEQINNTVHICA